MANYAGRNMSYQNPIIPDKGYRPYGPICTNYIVCLSLASPVNQRHHMRSTETGVFCWQIRALCLVQTSRYRLLSSFG